LAVSVEVLVVREAKVADAVVVAEISSLPGYFNEIQI
jgi:hypothetical protein